MTRAEHVREHFRTWRPARRARLHPAQRGRGHRLLRIRPRPGPVPRARHREPARRLAGLARRYPARLAGGRAHRARARPVLLFSHHPLETLVNDRAAGRTRICRRAARDPAPHPSGGVERHTPACGPPLTVVGSGDQRRRTSTGRSSRGCIELSTARAAIACTVIDGRAAATRDPADLAALARELAANDWQLRDLITADGGAGAGTAADRNVVLTVEWPRRAAHG